MDLGVLDCCRYFLFLFFFLLTASLTLQDTRLLHRGRYQNVAFVQSLISKRMKLSSDFLADSHMVLLLINLVAVNVFYATASGVNGSMVTPKDWVISNPGFKL